MGFLITLAFGILFLSIRLFQLTAWNVFTSNRWFDVSPTVIGKFKLEHKIANGIFLAPKSYRIQTLTDDEIIKHKGAGKAMADDDWFKCQLADTELKKTLTYEKKFHWNWGELLVQYKESKITLGLSSKKRLLIHDHKKKLVGTKPIHIGDDDFKK